MLTNDQINLIEQVITNRLGEAQPFDRFLRHINTVMLGAERTDMDSTKDWLFEHSSKYPDQRVSFDAYNQVKGELQLSLELLLEAASKAKADVAIYLAVRLLGTYWERVFCRRFGIVTKKQGRIYRAQKWHPLGASGFAGGTDQIEGGRVTLPDAMLMFEGRLVFAEIKNETLTTEKHASIGAGYYGLPQTDWWRIKRLLRLSPPIPYWFIIHEHRRLGRWNVIDDLRDWLVGDFRALGEPVSSQSPSGDTTDWSGGLVRHICYWRGDKFVGLDEALRQLEGGGG